MTRTIKRMGRKDAGTPAPAPSNAPVGAPAPAQAGSAQDTSLTADQVSNLVTAGVAAYFAKAAPPAPAPAPAAAPPPVPAPAPAPAPVMTAADVQATISQSIEKALAGLNNRGGFKQVADPSDANHRSQIEMPYSWTKGNLPLHGKQLLNILQRKHMNEGIDADVLSKGEQLGESRLAGRFSGKALTSTGSNTGDELVPSDLSSELQRRLYLASNLVAFMAPREIDMPTTPYTFPVSTTRPTFYLEATENTAATATDPGTASCVLTAKKLMGEVDLSYELEADSIIPVLPWVQTLLAEAAADATEDALLNGDSTGTHMDTDTQLIAKAAARAWKGLRRLSIGVSGCQITFTSGGFVVANVGLMRAQMGKYGIDTIKVALVLGVKTYNLLMAWSDLLTMDKAGQYATLFNGAKIQTLWGMPVIVSARCREDVDNTGVNGASGNTYYVATMFHAPSFILGRRKEFMVETDRVITSQTTKVVASFRKAFSPVETPSATVPSVQTAYAFNS